MPKRDKECSVAYEEEQEDEESDDGDDNEYPDVSEEEEDGDDDEDGNDTKQEEIVIDFEFFTPKVGVCLDAMQHGRMQWMHGGQESNNPLICRRLTIMV